MSELNELQARDEAKHWLETANDFDRKLSVAEARNRALQAQVDQLEQQLLSEECPCGDLARENKALRTDIDKLTNSLNAACQWLEASLQCKAWHWDGDQREAAQYELNEARAILSQPHHKEREEQGMNEQSQQNPRQDGEA